MIMLPSAVRIFLCMRPIDLRKSFDGLTGLVQECFGQDEPVALQRKCRKFRHIVRGVT